MQPLRTTRGKQGTGSASIILRYKINAIREKKISPHVLSVLAGKHLMSMRLELRETAQSASGHPIPSLAIG